eukprot:scaffold61284_cov43-Attheya_sp.AAC.2
MSNSDAEIPPSEADSLLQFANDTDPESDGDGAHRRRISSAGEAFDMILETINEAKDTIQTAAEAVAEAAVDAAEAVVEAAAEEIHVVEESILEELHHADDGDTFFLNMSLARNLSILPGEMQFRGEEAHTAMEDQAEEDLAEFKLTARTPSGQRAQKEAVMAQALRPPLSAYLLLASAVISLSSIGPLLKYQEGPTSTLKIVWRQSATSVLLLPMAIWALWKEGLPNLSSAQCVSFLIMVACYAVCVAGFAVSLDYTQVGNAVILSNSQSLIILAGKLFVGSHVSFMEGSGALVAFSGALICSEAAAKAGGPNSNTQLGDGLALLSAFGGVGYVVLAGPLRSDTNLFVFMYLNMFVGAVMIYGFMVFVLDETVTFDRNLQFGLFGWLNLQTDRLPLEIMIVIVCNMLGTFGYLRAMAWFSNVIILVAALLEPVVAELMSFSLGVGELPGLTGWVGNVLVLCGTMAVVWPSSTSETSFSH